MAIGKDIFGLARVIDYEFRDISRLECAVTHASYTNEQRLRGIRAVSNERLEFLGDAVLQIVVSEYLYSNYKNYREGALTKMRQRLVCERTLASAAERISLGDYLNVGHGEESNDCRRRPKVLADALEALIGAVYLDSQEKASEDYRRVVLLLLEDELREGAGRKTDYKTMLQQLIEQDGSAVLEYRVISEDGPEHKKTFTVGAYINNNKMGEGIAPTKKEAEMLAAAQALELFGVAL